MLKVHIYYFEILIVLPMQLYAKDSKDQVISAWQALKKCDHFCLECDGLVRLRGGPQRRPHFYHIDPAPSCRQHQKGMIHIQLQAYFMQQLPPGDCLIEHAFPSVDRIADVVWISRKIVFEIQYSAISAEEVLERNRDYASCGWQVVWILHDHRFNQIKLSAAEIALRDCHYYYSDMDQVGKGIIYDQYDHFEGALRKYCLNKLPVDIRTIFDFSEKLPFNSLKKRYSKRSFYFYGDLCHLIFQNQNGAYLAQIACFEDKIISVNKSYSIYQLLRHFWVNHCLRFYKIVFRLLLEHSCC